MPPTLAERVSVVIDLAIEALIPLWRVLSPTELLEALLDILPALIDEYGFAAGAVTADWYDDQRLDKAIGGNFTALVPDLGDSGAEELARWAVAPALGVAEPDIPAVQSRTEGGLQRRIANYSRETVMQSSVADPGAKGWQRVTNGTGCGFCVMLESRGAVYTRAGADFASHDHCMCSAEPSWKGEPIPVRPYTPSQRRVSDADRARTRAWIKANT